MQFFVANVLADGLSIGAVFQGSFNECVERGIRLAKEQLETPAEEGVEVEPVDEDAIRDELESAASFMDPDGAWCVNIFQVDN